MLLTTFENWAVQCNSIKCSKQIWRLVFSKIFPPWLSLEGNFLTSIFFLALFFFSLSDWKTQHPNAKTSPPDLPQQRPPGQSRSSPPPSAGGASPWSSLRWDEETYGTTLELSLQGRFGGCLSDLSLISLKSGGHRSGRILSSPF